MLTVSAPNAAGQSLFVAGVQEDGQILVAGYRIDAGGQLTRLVQDGDTVAGGQTIAIRYTLSNSYISVAGAALNGKEQLALPLSVGAAPDVLASEVGMLSLLIPTGP